ncbi:MAG: hypothetical protein ACRDJP_02415 [Actinomycetota bacterium]
MADEVDDVDEAQDAEAAPIEIDEPTLDRMRGTGVGVEDPNIVGDVGPTDVPPGRDPEGGLIETTDDGEDPQAVV